MSNTRVAAVQAMPAWMDRDATVEKAAGQVQQAAGEGARGIALSETFVPGYPWWIVLDDTRFANSQRRLPVRRGTSVRRSTSPGEIRTRSLLLLGRQMRFFRSASPSSDRLVVRCSARW